MKKELIKIRNKLLVYGLVISTGIGVASCTKEYHGESQRIDELKEVEQEENNFYGIKEKRLEYGK